MHKCTEFAVFLVNQENVDRAITLSHLIFAEMNALIEVISYSNVLVKTDNPEEICWHLEWVNESAAKSTTEKWPSFMNTAEFQSLVVKGVYYGHFLDTV
ncbi:MAG: hypothetical protein HRU38_08360 [Saccharospirillaceae bacterium]|nr:hypothetical protein [Pseudomonadales bacterium]NRB78666.1 hypothetical protein [Saccharospirillaceae bacterium]